MRITNGMQANNMLRSLQGSNERSVKLQEQLSTGRRINRPSDDPVGVSRSLRFNRDLAENTQYTSNIKDAISMLDMADSALDSIGNIIHRAKEIAISGANDTLPQESMDALAKELDELLNQAVQVANTSKSGVYIFAGQQVTQEPFELVAGPPDVVRYVGDGYDPSDVTLDGKLRYEIAPGVTDHVNYTGMEVFGQFTPDVAVPPYLPLGGGISTDNNLFNHLITLREALYNDNAADIQQSMADLDADLNYSLEARSSVGAKTNKMEMALNRMENAYVNISDQLAANDDTDMAAATIQLKLEENVYKSALSVGARIIQPSLVDFLN